MKIVIAGAGEVGAHLAKMLSKENHDIVLLDEDPKKLQIISNQIDMLSVAGYPNSFKDLKEAGTEKADLFIGVTPYEEQNIVACIFAKNLGAKKTIARINNGEYLLDKNKEKLINLGIDELIYPESLAAKEIVSSIKQVGTRQRIEFSGGKLMMMGVKVRENAPILNLTLAEISKYHNEIRVMAINRDGKTIIPHGSDTILNRDILFYIAAKGLQNEVFQMSGKEIFAVKNIMILGGSRIAQKTAERLGDQYNIKIIEIDRERSQKVADKMEHVLVIHGDGRNLDLLKEERIERMDAFIAVTGNSETNILACHLAKSMGVKRTVAEVENIDFMEIAENMDIGSLINKKLLAASYIYKHTVGTSVTHVTCLTASDAEVFEFLVAKNSKVTEKPIKDLEFMSDAIIGGVTRGHTAFIATGDTQIQEGDKVVIFALPTAVTKLEKYFK